MSQYCAKYVGYFLITNLERLCIFMYLKFYHVFILGYSSIQ